jgi:hypothetical protein
MDRILIAVALVLGVVGCGGTSSPPQTAGSAAPADGSGDAAGTGTAAADGDKGELMIAKMREYKATVCACKDAACVETAQKEIMDWALAHAEDLKDVKPTADQEAEATRLDGEIEACEGKLTGGAVAGSGATPSITAAEILAKMAEYKDKVCACKDNACVEKIEIEMGEWARANMEAMMALTPTKAEDAEADKIQARHDGVPREAREEEVARSRRGV